MNFQLNPKNFEEPYICSNVPLLTKNPLCLVFKLSTSKYSSCKDKKHESNQQALKKNLSAYNEIATQAKMFCYDTLKDKF
jgi:hypothetical protein